MQRQMLYGGVICYNETGLCQHFSLALTFSGCEQKRCVISRPSPRSPWTRTRWWEKESRDEWWKAAVGNKDAGVQSAVSQSWRGKREEEEDESMNNRY